MSEKRADEKLKKGYFFCEVCREKVLSLEAEKAGYLHCGRKMTPMEAAYMSEPSPTGV